MTSDRLDERLSRKLRDSAERSVPAALDHRVRVALRTMPLSGALSFASPEMALGLAVAATLAMMTSLALSFAAAGAGETGVALAAALVVGYLGVASVVVLPLLIKVRTSRRDSEVEA